MPDKRYLGTVIVDKSAYGFIECPEFPKNVFYHYSQCQPEEQIHLGDIVSFDVKENQYGDKQATNVRLERELE